MKDKLLGVWKAQIPTTSGIHTRVLGFYSDDTFGEFASNEGWAYQRFIGLGPIKIGSHSAEWVDRGNFTITEDGEVNLIYANGRSNKATLNTFGSELKMGSIAYSKA